MFKGGYQIVDFKDVALSSDAVTIPGVYEIIEGNYGKALLLSGLNVDSIERADVFAQAITEAGNYTFTVYGGTLTVANGDSITFVK